MRQLSEKTLAALIRDLDYAVHDLRELAIQHAYRHRACKAVGERILATYHDDKHGQTLDLARILVQHRLDLAALVKVAPVSRRSAA
jgi:hypothetical protein